ncbi:cell division protein SepF [Anaeropeptidivorans aminofermentans]|jgi:cell division inhibitor SepF|uniref:cell division protein SepF n=1 Tax=Anaeropeptidivorans aminofermentans TaxID=2934315 RepID=UPI0020244120|nr:cell division protein SepF [Anaeropeptidivorans aminofermentans]MBE6013014.1 cell division protein SepF [Lachnospiraceae bacterium]
MPEIFKKLKDALLGVDIEDEMDYDDEYEEYDEPVVERPTAEIKSFQPRLAPERARGTSNIRSLSSNVVDLHRKSQIDIVLPKNIEDARDVIDNTKSDIISVVNLEGVDGADAQRIADFLSGSVDALDGNIRRLSNDMFVIAPRGVEITGAVSSEINEEIRSFGLSSSWLNSAFK